MLGADGKVFNVWRGRHFYAPGGPYSRWLGGERRRQFAKNRLDGDPDYEPDDGAPLNPAERASLALWVASFEGKYDVVGKLVDGLSMPVKIGIDALDCWGRAPCFTEQGKLVVLYVAGLEAGEHLDAPRCAPDLRLSCSTSTSGRGLQQHKQPPHRDSVVSACASARSASKTCSRGAAPTPPSDADLLPIETRHVLVAIADRAQTSMTCVINPREISTGLENCTIRS